MGESLGVVQAKRHVVKLRGGDLRPVVRVTADQVVLEKLDQNEKEMSDVREKREEVARIANFRLITRNRYWSEVGSRRRRTLDSHLSPTQTDEVRD